MSGAMPSVALEDDRLIWFAHCPKAGGTSMETLFVETWGDRVGHLRWGWDLWWKNGGWRQASPPNSPQHLIWADAKRILPASPDIVFALVRDPVDRMMSEHRYQRRFRRGTALGRALAYLPFSIWLPVMLAVVRRNPYAFDNHLRPQSDFIPSHARVFRLEDGLEPAVGWLRDVVHRADLAAPRHLLKTRPNPRPHPRLRARIAAAFAEDYTRFGYDRPAEAATILPLLERVADLVAWGVVALDRRGLI